MDDWRGSFAGFVGIETTHNPFLHCNDHASGCTCEHRAKSKGSGHNVKDHVRKTCDMQQDNDQPADYIE